MLQPRQLAGQHLVGLHQLREPPRPRGDPLILRGDPPSLTAHDDNQLIARHLLQPGHKKIEAQPSRSHRDRHADSYITNNFTAGQTPG
ncbi:MAG: hypothetical protein ACRDR6_05800 [Pseudonocardiaceae bacterium]